MDMYISLPLASDDGQDKGVVAAAGLFESIPSSELTRWAPARRKLVLSANSVPRVNLGRGLEEERWK